MKSTSRPNKPAASVQWAWHERALLRLRDELRNESEFAGEMFRTTPERGGEDIVDRANDRVTRDVLLAEHSLREHALAEIDAALERIARGTYGICEDTGEPIEPARLRALPWTRYSFRAAARREKDVKPD